MGITTALTGIEFGGTNRMEENTKNIEYLLFIYLLKDFSFIHCESANCMYYKKKKIKSTNMEFKVL